MVLTQWKQRLYAFLLRRVLGPYLSSSSLKKLHESIEVSLQEGKFMLKDVDLNAAYLTRILSKRGESYVTIATVRRARIRKLQINLTMEETHHEGSDSTSGKARSSVAWRAMKLGQGIDSEGGSVMLLAHAEIEGFDIDLEPGHDFTPPPPPKPEPSSPSEASSTVGMISSYVEAALSSLRLSVQMKDLRVKLFSSVAGSSPSQFVEFHLAGAQYHDVDDRVASQRQQSSYQTVLHKAIDFSGITFRTGEELPVLNEGASHDTVTGKDSMNDSSTTSVIAKTEGSGQVSLRFIEYNSTTTAISEDVKATKPNESEPPRIQQDLEVSLNQRLNFSVDKSSIQSLLEVTTSFLRHVAESEESASKTSTTIEANTSDGRLDELDSSATDINADKEDLDAMAGIMKQYAEARHLAERNELRGGILLPSTAYEEGAADDGSVSFDAFFDANDHSFSLYQSRMEQSIMASAVLNDEEKDFVHTKLRFHLQQCGVKVVFPRSDEGLSPEKSWHRAPDEYILLSLGDISLTSSLSQKVSDISLNAVHLEIEDSFRARPSNASRTDYSPSIQIGNVLRFDRGSEEEGDGLVTEAPCISLHVLAQHVSTSKSTADLILEPLELTFSGGTLSNILCLVSQLEVGESHRASSNAVPVSEGGDQSRAWRFSASCPSITIGLPLGLNSGEGATAVDHFSAVFERCGHILPRAPISTSTLGFSLDALSVLYESKATESSEEPCLASYSGSGGDTTVSCHRFLCFVTSPRVGIHGSARCMQRADIFASSGHAPLSLTYRSMVSLSDEAPGKSSFPVVPPLSTFKARQEDEDSDSEDAFCREFSSFAENANPAPARASDPQGLMLQEAELCSSVIEIYLPELVGDLTRDEAMALSNLLVTELSSIGKDNAKSSKMSEETTALDSCPTTSISVSIDQVTLIAHQMIDDDTGVAGWYSHETMAEGFKAHAVLSSSRLKTARVLAHELNLFEVRDLVQTHDIETQSVPSFRDRCDNVRRRTFQNGDSVATPILYRSQLFPPLSPESPAVLIDILAPTADEWNAHFTVYNVTHRYDVQSRWLCRLQTMLGVRDPTGGQETTSAPSSVKERQPEMEPSLFKIFVSLADCNIDYTTPKTFSTPSRMLVRLGDLRLSSILVLPLGQKQACRISLGDLTILLCNTRYDHIFENTRLGRAKTVLGKDQIAVTKKEVMPDDVLRSMNLITMLTLDAVDMMLASSIPDPDVGDNVADPSVMVGVTLGMLSLYGCKDSFECFTNTLGELQLYATALDEEAIKAMKERSPMVRVDAEGEPSSFLNSILEAQGPGKGAEIGASIATAESRLTGKFSLGEDDWATVETEWSQRADIAPDEEQAARWYSEDNTNESDSQLDVHISAVHLDRNSDPEPTRPTKQNFRIISNHFPLKPVSDPFSESDPNIAKYAGTSLAPRSQARILVRDAKLRCRFFDGYDWPKQKKRRYHQGADFVIEPVPQEKLETEKQELNEQIADRVTDSQTNKLETKAKLLGDLLDDDKPGEDQITFVSTPLPEERGALLEDLAEQRRLSRRMNKFLQISLSGLKMRLDTFAETDEHRLASCIDVSMADFFVAETISTSKPVKLLGEWMNETLHPRDSNDGLIMMKMVTWHPKYRITEDNEIENDESQVTLEVLPLRCNIDQRAVRFSMAFFAAEAEDGVTEKPIHAWAVGLKEIPPPLFQSFKVKPCKLKVNYTPVKVNVEALREGSYVELINLSPLVDMVITLQEVHMQGLIGFGPNVKELLSRWIEDVCATQMYKFLANARPFQPISSVGGSAANLVVVPWEAYKKGDKVGRAMRSGAASFAGSVAYETLNTSAKLTGLAAQALSSATPDRRSVESSVSSSFLPSRPNETPRGIGDTANHALESLARGFETANYKIVIVPYREYRRSGTTGAVKSVMRGIPVAIAAPVGAATEALSYTLLGARNQVRPDKRKEEEASERGLRHDF